MTAGADPMMARLRAAQGWPARGGVLILHRADRHRDYWRASSSSPWRCATCHPPAVPALAVELEHRPGAVRR
jgi:hypothetical protein